MRLLNRTIAIFLLSLLTTYANAAIRTALVIGNGSYKSAPLANPVNDAADMANTLEKLGFEVIHKADADKGSMLLAIDEFGRKLRKAEVGLFYYAGHGMQVRRQNYLIPVQAYVTSETDVEYAAVAAGRVAGKMEEAGNAVNIIILDACRDNPFKRSFRSSSQGLARMDAAEGTFVAYATGPGSVAEDGAGRNGVFTKHLLRQMIVPNQPIEKVLKKVRKAVLSETSRRQMPWQSSSLTGEFYFTASSAAIVEQPGPTSLSLTCNVSGAQVLINGKSIGTTPLKSVSVKPGKLRLQLEKQGYVPYQRTLTIQAGRTAAVSVYLEPVAPRQARLYVNPLPAGARVRILNVTPSFTQGIALDAGRYHVEVSADKYMPEKMWVDLAAGEDKHLDVRLQPKSSARPGRIKNTLGMEFVWIEPGTFTMGSPPGEEGRDDDEKQHQVTLTRGVYLQTTEVTVGQWRQFVNATGHKSEAETGGGAYIWDGKKWEKKAGTYWEKPGFTQTDNHAVTCVSWNDVQAFIRWVNQQCEGTYSLPTETQWEYACRGNTTMARFWGDDPDQACRYANAGDKDHWGRNVSNCDDGFKYTAPVGQFKPNAFGLHDMLGNVWEWCADWYGDYPAGAVTNPGGPSGGFSRVGRGGGWYNTSKNVRCAVRSRYNQGSRFNIMGFRLSRE